MYLHDFYAISTTAPRYSSSIWNDKVVPWMRSACWRDSLDKSIPVKSRIRVMMNHHPFRNLRTVATTCLEYIFSRPSSLKSLRRVLSIHIPYLWGSSRVFSFSHSASLHERTRDLVAGDEGGLISIPARQGSVSLFLFGQQGAADSTLVAGNNFVIVDFWRGFRVRI